MLIVSTFIVVVLTILGAVTQTPTKMSNSMLLTRGEDWVRQREKLYSERRKRVRSVCAKYEDVWQKNYFAGAKFLFDLKNGLAYCRHEKVKNGLNWIKDHRKHFIWRDF